MQKLDDALTVEAFRQWLTDRKGEVVGVVGDGYQSPLHEFLAEKLPPGTDLRYLGRELVWIDGAAVKLPAWAIAYIDEEDRQPGEPDETVGGVNLIYADDCLRILEAMS